MEPIDSIKLELESLVDQLITQYGGCVFYFGGGEGSGKSDLLDALVTAAPDKVVPIYFSDALTQYIGANLQSNDQPLEKLAKRPGLQGMLAQARLLMNERKKNINPHVIQSALYNSIRNGFGDKLPKPNTHPNMILVADGFPRVEDQPGMVPNIFGEWFGNQPGILVEAVCPREVAIERALKRGKATDTQPLLNAAHDEYEKTIRAKVFPAMATYADHLSVDSSATREEKLADFVRVLGVHCEGLHTHGFATASGQRVTGRARRQTAPANDSRDFAAVRSFATA